MAWCANTRHWRTDFLYQVIVTKITKLTLIWIHSQKVVTSALVLGFYVTPLQLFGIQFIRLIILQAAVKKMDAIEAARKLSSFPIGLLTRSAPLKVRLAPVVLLLHHSDNKTTYVDRFKAVQYRIIFCKSLARLAKILLLQTKGSIGLAFLQGQHKNCKVKNSPVHCVNLSYATVMRKTRRSCQTSTAYLDLSFEFRGNVCSCGYTLSKSSSPSHPSSYVLHPALHSDVLTSYSIFKSFALRAP
ncbi:hypothetical protein HUJ05_003488 [Dendroctonus ponderosae]|nr:hypothetical protein HUJ05_003488 [Dendroctonus ponderosae]